MTHDVIKHFLDDYVTGELSEEARAPVAEHIAGCEICSAEVEDLKKVLARAAELPREVKPPAEAWSHIRTAISNDVAALRDGQTIPRARPWQRPYAIAAAAVIAAVLSSGATYYYLRVQGPTAAVVAATTGDSTPATLAAFTVEENNYLRTAAILQDLLDQQESALAPETVAQLKASLRTIDEAILEARNALARDPANKMLVEMLSASYRQKVDLLRRTTEMTRGS
ncbi:MAG: zf-HC2 domain-containing protein [Gemmatimonadaceae bacterium]